MGAFGQFAATSQFYLYGRRHFTRTGYERARLLRKGPDLLETVDAAGKCFLVTGANSGVGMDVSLFLAKKGATVNMVCRSEKRGEEARQSIVAQSGNDKVHLWVCDLSLESDVRAMWSRFAAAHEHLDGLVCNAGVLLNERTLTSEGVETTFACHLLFGTYLLGSLAMPLLEATAGSRLVAVSSGGMYNTKWPEWDMATSEKGTYNGQLAYAYAKRGQVLLCERWSELHPSVPCVTTHPGWTLTPAVEAAYGDSKKYLEPMRSPWEGAEGIAWLCVAPAEELTPGAFYLDRKVEPKHLAGPFFTGGSFTKNSPADVDLMVAKLDAWSNGRRSEVPAAEAGMLARATPLKESQKPIEISRFMGKWYVVAAIPTMFDRGVVNEVEEYSWNEAKQRIEVHFTMQAGFDAPVKAIAQRATIVNGAPTPDAPTGINTRWALSPRLGGVWLPFGLAYLVVDCAPDYSTTIIGVPDRSVLYVMARTPQLDDATLEPLLDTCRRSGFDMSQVVRVEHDTAAAATVPQVPETAAAVPISDQ